MLFEEPVQPGPDLVVRREERLAIGEADLLKLVPVRSAGRERERPAGGDAEQATLGIEEVEQRIEVVFVRATAMEEDERTGRFAGRFPCCRCDLN
jgi:hypothetical protein